MGPRGMLALLLVATLGIGGCLQQSGVPSAALTGSYQWTAAGAPPEPGAALVLDTLAARHTGVVAVSGQLVAATGVSSEDVSEALDRLGFERGGDLDGWEAFHAAPAAPDPALVGIDLVALRGDRLLAGPADAVEAAAPTPLAEPDLLAIMPHTVNLWVAAERLPAPPAGPFGTLQAPEAIGAVVTGTGGGGLWIAVPPDPREAVAAALAYQIDSAALDDVLTAQGPRWHEELDAWWVPVTWRAGASTELTALLPRLRAALVGS